MGLAGSRPTLLEEHLKDSRRRDNEVPIGLHWGLTLGFWHLQLGL